MASLIKTNSKFRGVVRAAFALLAGITLAGCGGETEDLYPVTGQVTFRGDPLPGGYVTFVPESGAPVRCVIEGQGNYKGNVPAGKCRVSIIAVSGIQANAASSATQAPDSQVNASPEPTSKKPNIPRKYENHKTSGLEYEVQLSGENGYDIPLK